MADNNPQAVRMPGATQSLIDDARGNLRSALNVACGPIMSIGTATQIGNRINFALQVLNDSTTFDRQSITVSVEAHPEVKPAE